MTKLRVNALVLSLRETDHQVADNQAHHVCRSARCAYLRRLAQRRPAQMRYSRAVTLFPENHPMSRLDNPFHDQEAGRADSTQYTTRIDDVRIGAVRPLICPALLQDDLPVPLAVQTLVERSRVEIADVLQGRDDRLVIVVGPCSIHDHDQALEYAHLLKAAADELREDLLIVMRVYFEKPRTTVGWKGYINDPLLDGTFRINEGLRLARQLLLEVAQLGLPAAPQ